MRDVHDDETNCQCRQCNIPMMSLSTVGSKYITYVCIECNTKVLVKNGIRFDY